MFIEGLINQGSAPVLERVIQFTAARHRVLAENIVNASTPGYIQRDLSVQRFQDDLRRRIEQRRSTGSRRAGMDDLRGQVERPRRGILFQDGANRSMEHLMSEQAKNALMHNLAIELLRRQFESLKSALRERVM